MDMIRTISASACFIAVAVSIAEAMCPEKKFEKQMRIIFALFFAVAVISPIASGSFSIELPEMNVTPNEISYATEVSEEEFLANIEENVNKSLSDELERRNLSVKEISVSVNISDEESISIGKVNFKPENAEDISAIEDEIRALLGDDVEISGGV